MSNGINGVLFPGFRFSSTSAMLEFKILFVRSELLEPLDSTDANELLFLDFDPPKILNKLFLIGETTFAELLAASPFVCNFPILMLELEIEAL